MTLNLTFAAHITGANEATRQISGIVVPFGKTGNTSAGPVIFEVGSISNPDPKPVKFLLQHQADRPIGRAIEFQVTPGGITGTFKVSNTTAGSDALVEASDGLRDGLSVGAQIDKFTVKDGVMHVTAAKIVEVSLVHAPAFSDAVVTDVAASEAEAVADTIPEEDQVSEQPIETPEVEVEAAAAPVVQASSPIQTAPRLNITAAGYLENSIKAMTGNDEARQYVRAADDSTSTNTGLTLPQHLQEFVTNTIADRPAVNAVSRQALVSSGMTFTVPKLGTAPTVASTSEGTAPSETGMTSDYLTGTVVKYAGANDVSWELIDRSSPEFYAELLTQMQNAYAKATDEAVLSVLASGGTQAATTAATAAGFISYVGTESAACFAGSKKKARNVVINTDWWGTLLGATDTAGRPLFTASNVQNNPGVLSGQGIEGNIMGLNVYVDPYTSVTTKIDDSAFIVAPEAVTWYEAPTTRLQVQLIETGQVRVGVYGYGCALVKQASGIRRFNLT
jgi:HK97 family phage major capsid protein